MGPASKGDLKILAILLAALAFLVIVAIAFGGPLLADFTAALAPGVGLKEAAKWSFGTTVVLFIIFAIAAGDGLLGELQYMLGGFFAFFAIITVLIAWVF